MCILKTLLFQYYLSYKNNSEFDLAGEKKEAGSYSECELLAEESCTFSLLAAEGCHVVNARYLEVLVVILLISVDDVPDLCLKSEGDF